MYNIQMIFSTNNEAVAPVLHYSEKILSEFIYKYSIIIFLF